MGLFFAACYFYKFCCGSLTSWACKEYFPSLIFIFELVLWFIHGKSSILQIKYHSSLLCIIEKFWAGLWMYCTIPSGHTGVSLPPQTVNITKALWTFKAFQIFSPAFISAVRMNSYICITEFSWFQLQIWKQCLQHSPLIKTYQALNEKRKDWDF